jgi:hypothetical protein
MKKLITAQTMIIDIMNITIMNQEISQHSIK